MTALLALSCQSGSSSPFLRVCTAISSSGFPGSDVVGVVVQNAIQALVLFVIVVAVGRFLRRFTTRALQRTGADAQVRTLVNNVFTIVTLTVAVFAALTAGGLSINVLLTFGGLTSLALGLAFQDLLRNILAGIFLLIERPFRIGDWITVGDQSGSVQTIQLRTTALRTADGRLVILPNLSAFSSPVVNSTAYDVRQFSVALRLPGGAGLEDALGKVRQVVEANPAVSKEPRPFLQPRLDSDGGVTLTVRYWVEYRSNNPDALSAELVAALHAALGPWPQLPPGPPQPGVTAG